MGGGKVSKKTLCQICVNLIDSSWHLLTQHATSVSASSQCSNFCASAKSNSSPNTFSIDSAALISSGSNCSGSVQTASVSPPQSAAVQKVVLQPWARSKNAPQVSPAQGGAYECGLNSVLTEGIPGTQLRYGCPEPSNNAEKCMYECGSSTANSLGYAAGNTLGTNAFGNGIEGRIPRAEANHAAQRCGCTPQGVGCPSRPMFGRDDRHDWCKSDSEGGVGNYGGSASSLTIEQYYKFYGKPNGTSSDGGRVTHHWNDPLNENIIPSKYGTELSQTEWLEKLQEMKGG